MHTHGTTSLVIILIINAIRILPDKPNVIRQLPLTETAQAPLRLPLSG